MAPAIWKLGFKKGVTAGCHERLVSILVLGLLFEGKRLQSIGALRAILEDHQCFDDEMLANSLHNHDVVCKLHVFGHVAILVW